METITDEQLVKQYLAKGDEAILEKLIKRYLPLVFGFVKRYTGNQGDASDITQEAFVKVWKNIKSFDQSKNFRTWIFTIAKRTAIDWLRKNRAIPFSFLETEGSDPMINFLVDESPSFLEQLITGETSKELALAMEKLPTDYRSVVELHVNDGLRFRQIAERFREPLNTVKSRYRRGIALLKELL